MYNALLSGSHAQRAQWARHGDVPHFVHPATLRWQFTCGYSILAFHISRISFLAVSFSDFVFTQREQCTMHAFASCVLCSTPPLRAAESPFSPRCWSHLGAQMGCLLLHSVPALVVQLMVLAQMLRPCSKRTIG